MSSRGLCLLSSLVLVSALGCEAESVPALDLELVQDLSINTPEQVLERVESILVILDSAEGLYEPGSEWSEGGFEVRNTDLDPSDLELVATVPVDEGRLPWIRIEQGGLPRGPIDIRVLGGASGEVESHPVAEGLTQSVLFDSDVATLTIPFNIRPELLPPRVVDVIPGLGEVVQGCEVSDIVVLFSKPIDPESLRGAIILEPGGSPLEVLHDASGLVAHVKVPPIVGTAPDETGTLSYQIVLSTDIIDLEGQRLDQIPTEADAQPYLGEFTLSCSRSPMRPVSICIDGAREDACPFPNRLRCLEGLCQPVSCDRADCLPGFLCSDDSAACEIDCRIYGVSSDRSICPEPRPVCNEATGRCVGD